MRSTLQRVGNSQGVIIPKPILAQVGLERDVEIEVEHDAVVIRKPKGHVRAGWADASRAIAEASEDALVWPEFGNEADKELTW
jgi:antitoxin MazE